MLQLILSPNVFDIVSEFEVVDFNPMFSDVHNRLHFSFELGQSQGDPNTQQNVNKGSITSGGNSTNLMSLTRCLLTTGNVLQQVNGVLDSLNTGTVTPDQVNSVLDDIGATLINTASIVFGPENSKPGKSGTYNNKPWFTRECKTKRDNFHRARDKFTKDKSDVNKNSLNNVAKDYRKVLNTSYSSYREKCSKDLRSLSKSDTKAFWKTLHKYSTNKKDNPDLDVEFFLNILTN